MDASGTSSILFIVIRDPIRIYLFKQTIETLEKVVKYVTIKQKRDQNDVSVVVLVSFFVS